MVKWADTNDFKFFYSKTVVVHFCKIRKFHLDPDLYLKKTTEYHVLKKHAFWD